MRWDLEFAMRKIADYEERITDLEDKLRELCKLQN
jgi:hypothetical protein